MHLQAVFKLCKCMCVTVVIVRQDMLMIVRMDYRMCMSCSVMSMGKCVCMPVDMMMNKCINGNKERTDRH